jgi:hypothetical protein
MMSEKNDILELLFKEYDKLKSEQVQRIGFRDNLLYVTLGLCSTVISFSVSNSSNYYALLIIPWVCFILGWTYVVNDEKISAIGKYIRYNFSDKVKGYTGQDLITLFAWETTHRDDKHRKRRKFYQLIVDEVAFVFSGMIALLIFWSHVPNSPIAVKLLSCFELISLFVLAIEIYIYSDLVKGK